MRSTVLRVPFAVLVLAACGCGNYLVQPGAPDPPDTTVRVEGVRLTPQTIHFEAIGETKQLVATIAPTNATDRAVTWETSNPAVATVDAQGVVTARGAGADVFITVFTHDGHRQSSVNVSVNP